MRWMQSAAALSERPADYGFFGPDSVSWKVWTSPTAILGFQRAVVLEHFDPYLAAAVADMQGIYTDPKARLDNTLAYFLTVAVGDSETASNVARHLMSVHAKAKGVEPISGKRYSANNPDSQLWIHVTGWHSVLKCYEMYGPGPLDESEECRYWAECVTAAALQTCRTSEVPTSREQVRDYFAQVRPRLCSSERAQRAMHYLLRAPLRSDRVVIWGISRLMAPATIATLPRWMRELGGFDQPAALDAAIIPAARVAIRTLAAQPKATARLLRPVVPTTARVLDWHLHRREPLDPVVVAPEPLREVVASDTR